MRLHLAVYLSSIYFLLKAGSLFCFQDRLTFPQVVNYFNYLTGNVKVARHHYFRYKIGFNLNCVFAQPNSADCFISISYLSVYNRSNKMSSAFRLVKQVDKIKTFLIIKKFSLGIFLSLKIWVDVSFKLLVKFEDALIKHL